MSMKQAPGVFNIDKCLSCHHGLYHWRILFSLFVLIKVFFALYVILEFILNDALHIEVIFGMQKLFNIEDCYDKDVTACKKRSMNILGEMHFLFVYVNWETHFIDIVWMGLHSVLKLFCNPGMFLWRILAVEITRIYW